MVLVRRALALMRRRCAVSRQRVPELVGAPPRRRGRRVQDARPDLREARPDHRAPRPASSPTAGRACRRCLDEVPAVPRRAGAAHDRRGPRPAARAGVPEFDDSPCRRRRSARSTPASCTTAARRWSSCSAPASGTLMTTDLRIMYPLARLVERTRSAPADPGRSSPTSTPVTFQELNPRRGVAPEPVPRQHRRLRRQQDDHRPRGVLGPLRPPDDLHGARVGHPHGPLRRSWRSRASTASWCCGGAPRSGPRP